VDIVVAGVGGLADIVPAMGTKQIIRALSIMAEKVKAGGEIPDRAIVVDDLHRAAKLALLTAKVAEGKATEKDAETLDELLYDPKKDAAK
jgi:hypothetical protein